MSACGYVDESARAGRYVPSLVLVAARDVAELGRQVRGLLERRQRRLHLHTESPGRRRKVLASIGSMPFTAIAWTARGRREHEARAACLTAIVAELQARAVPRLVIESRQDDRDDRVVIHRVRAREPRLEFEHRRGRDVPALWLADAIAWAVSAGTAHVALVGGVEVRSAEP
jgi:hypothetical protein